MSVNVINLDSIVPDDRLVKLGGKELTIPGDSSLEYALNSIKYAQILKENPLDYATMEKAFENMFNEIKPKNPDLNLDEFRRSITAKQYAHIVAMLYGTPSEPEKKTFELPSVEQKEVTP